MASLILRARLFDDDDKPVPRHGVSVEMFDLASGAWRAVVEARTDDKGVIDTRFDLARLSIGKLGPALRLVEPGSPARVLSPGPMLSITGRARDLLADFGEIERLGDTGFDRLDTGGGRRDTVAGFARKAGVPQTNIMRNVLQNPRLGAVIGGTAARPAPVDYAREGVIRADMDPSIAAEIETMRAISLDAAAKLTEKDRIIATREHELGLKTAALGEALSRATVAEEKLKAAGTASVGKEADIQTVFTDIGLKLGATQETLKAAKTPFRIGTVRVDLKGALAEQAKIALGGTAGDGSGVSVDLTPDTGGPGDTGVTVPDVTGLTLSAARRVLRSVGLRIETATQTMAADTATHGAALRQTPAAGSRDPHGSTVLVVFATVPDA